MLSIRFYIKPIKKTNSKGEKPIIMTISFGDEKRIVLHIGKMIRPSDWSKSYQKAKNIYGNPEKSKAINTAIMSYKNRAEELYNYAIANGIKMDANYFKKGIKKKKVSNPNQNDQPKKKPFWDYFEDFIISNKAIKKERTIKNYNTVKSFLKDFEESEKIKLNFEMFSFEVFDSLRNYSFNIRGVKNSYFGKIVSVLKTFYRWADKRGYHSTKKYLDFKAEKIPDNEIIYLDEHELKLLHNYEFKKSPLAKARDIYCFACYTGLRFSDVDAMRKSNIIDGVIYKKILKTNENVSIPVISLAEKILRKYDFKDDRILPKMSNQKVNDYIKLACKECGITAQVSVYDYIGKDKIELNKPKYELITFHTARKTFVTLSLIKKMNIPTIREITGHKSDKVFAKYLKITEEYKKDEMKNAWG